MIDATMYKFTKVIGYTIKKQFFTYKSLKILK